MLLFKFKIQGHSMEPFLHQGDKVIVSSIPYIFKSPKIGDIVAFKYGKKVFIKRINLVEDRKYFLEGDNKKDSLDSKSFGFIPEQQIIGKYIYKLK